MKRRSKAGGKASKARGGEASKTKRGNAAKVAHRSSVGGKGKKITLLTRERDEPMAQPAAAAAE